MTEKSALIREKPLCKVPTAFRPGQVDAVRQQVLLHDVELGVHYLEKQAGLLGQLARTPRDTKSQHRGEQ